MHAGFRTGDHRGAATHACVTVNPHIRVVGAPPRACHILRPPGARLISFFCVAVCIVEDHTFLSFLPSFLPSFRPLARALLFRPNGADVAPLRM